MAAGPGPPPPASPPATPGPCTWSRSRAAAGGSPTSAGKPAPHRAGTPPTSALTRPPRAGWEGRSGSRPSSGASRSGPATRSASPPGPAPARSPSPGAAPSAAAATPKSGARSSPCTGRPGPPLALRLGGTLQAGVDRLALQGQHPEDALMHAEQRLAPDEPFQRLHPERELADRQGPLAAEVALAQPVQVAGQRVFGAVDDPQVLPPPALDPGLGYTAASPGDRAGRLDHHALFPAPGELLPPRGHGRLSAGVIEVRHDVPGGREQRVGGRQAFGGVHVPGVVAVKK